MEPETIRALKETRKALVREVKGILPHGYKKDIAKRANVSYPTVIRFFNGEDNRELYRVLTEYLDEYIQETNKLGEKANIS